MTTIAIVDYGAGNLLSLSRALEAVGATTIVTADPNLVSTADAIALPGVGAAGSAMTALRERDLLAVLHERHAQGTPIIGICLGMQLMYDWLTEGDCAGLGWLPGTVTPLPPTAGYKIPHMGWNRVAWDAALPPPACAGLDNDFYAYFVHTYRCEVATPASANITLPLLAWTTYNTQLCSLVCADTLWGTQFHPEKSGAAGLTLLRNFVALSRTTGGDA